MKITEELKKLLEEEPVDFYKIGNLLQEAKGKKIVIDLAKMPHLISYEQVVYYISALGAELIDKDETQA